MPPKDGDKYPFLTRKMLAFQEGVAFSLQIKSTSSFATTLTIRGMTKEGIFTFKHILVGTGVYVTEIFRIPDIPISVSVIDELAVFGQAQNYVEVNLLANNGQLASLCSGNVYQQHSITYPSSNSTDKYPTQGFLDAKTSNNPAAGVEHNYAIPGSYRGKIIGIAFDFITNATVANRRVHIRFETAAGEQWLDVESGVDQAASLTRSYWVNAHPAKGTVAVGEHLYIPIPLNVIVGSGDSIRTYTDNLQAGDDYGPMTIYYERWPG